MCAGTFFGMLFALNFPITSAWFKAVEGASPAVEWGCKLAVAVVLLGASAVWAATVLPLPKLAYNRCAGDAGPSPMSAGLIHC